MSPYSVSEETVGVLPFVHHGLRKKGIGGEVDKYRNRARTLSLYRNQGEERIPKDLK